MSGCKGAAVRVSAVTQMKRMPIWNRRPITRRFGVGAHYDCLRGNAPRTRVGRELCRHLVALVSNHRLREHGTQAQPERHRDETAQRRSQRGATKSTEHAGQRWRAPNRITAKLITPRLLANQVAAILNEHLKNCSDVHST